MNPRIANIFQPSQLLPSIAAGLVIGILIVNIEISFASLIFSSALSSHLADGIGFTLFGAMVIGAVVALTSSYPGAIGMPISNPVPLLAFMAATIAQRMAANTTGDAMFATVATTLAATSILTGIALLGLGQFKLGALIRFVPYPVIGGFLAGTGWMLAQGAIGTMAGIPFTLPNLPRFIESEVILRWIPGVVFGFLLLFILRHYKHYLILPGMVVGGILLFDGFLWITNISTAQASARGWLLGSFPAGSLWHPLTLSTLAQVDWSLVLAQWDKVGSVFVVSLIALLLNSTGMELSVRRDIDLNRELSSAGAGNILAGLGGGTVGYHTQVITLLGYRMGANSRLIGLVYAAVCGVCLFWGTSLFVFLPKPVPTGLLLYLGLVMLVEWIYDAWFKLTRVDHALVLLIMATIVGIGFLEGIATGVIISIVLFVVKYSRIQVVRHTLTGASFHSTMDRPPSERQFLRECGVELQALQLQGFLFFGTAQTLLDQIRGRIDSHNLPRLRFLVLDFGRTNGLDSSAVSSFIKLKQIAEANHLQLVLTSVSTDMRCQLERGGLSKSPIICWAPTLDAGVEWCEDQILASAEIRLPEIADDLPAQLAHVFPRAADVGHLLSYFHKEQVDAGKWLVRQGELADALYFIGDGLATAQLELADGRTIRLRTMRCGTTIGEVGLYLGTTRSASVRTEHPGTLYRLSVDAIQQMETRDPELAVVLHKWIARLMAERLAENNTTLAAMLD